MSSSKPMSWPITPLYVYTDAATEPPDSIVQCSCVGCDAFLSLRTSFTPKMDSFQNIKSYGKVYKSSMVRDTIFLKQSCSVLNASSAAFIHLLHSKEIIKIDTYITTATGKS